MSPFIYFTCPREIFVIHSVLLDSFECTPISNMADGIGCIHRCHLSMRVVLLLLLLFLGVRVSEKANRSPVDTDSPALPRRGGGDSFCNRLEVKKLRHGHGVHDVGSKMIFALAAS